MAEHLALLCNDTLYFVPLSPLTSCWLFVCCKYDIFFVYVDLGKEQSVALDNLSSEEILQELKTLVLNGPKT